MESAYSNLANYGKWCGWKRTKIGTDGCACPAVSAFASMVGTCSQNIGYIDPLDAACLKHDLCSCFNPKYGLSNVAAYKGPDLPIHYCECEENLYNEAKAVDCKGDSSCQSYRKNVLALFGSYPCACPASKYRCHTGFLFFKKWYDCDSKVVSNFNKCS